MPKLSPIKAKELINLLGKKGFAIVRQKGSHAILKDGAGRNTVVPIHPREEIHPGLLRKIIQDIGITVEEFNNLRKK